MINSVIQGDCLEVMKTLEDNSVDSIVTDPPYGLSFMGKKWDYDVPKKEIWEECLRVLKPGGYLLSFAGTRTQHRMAVNIEDAGFEIRDMIAWVYGSGFPKSHNIGKAVSKIMGEEVKQGVAFKTAGEYGGRNLQDPTPINDREQFRHKPTTEEGKQWEGWGTALKPALEPITVARKPLSEKTVAENVLKWGTGGINIDGSRVEGELTYASGKPSMTKENGWNDNSMTSMPERTVAGRFPANFIHDGSDEVVGLFPETNKSKSANRGLQHSSRHGGLADIGGNIKNGTDTIRGHNDNGGSASRFFYCAKASKSDRNEGLEGFEEKAYAVSNQAKAEMKRGNGFDGHEQGDWNAIKSNKNNHPTVKPTKLMQYLVKLVTPKGGVCLDPFMGSGSTGKACKLEGFDFIGIEMDEEYCKIAEARLANTVQGCIM